MTIGAPFRNLAAALAVGFAVMYGQTPEVAKPEVAVAVNGTQETEVFQGDPLVVIVLVQHPLRFAPADQVRPIKLGKDGEGWAAVVSLRIRDQAGAAEWPLELVSPPTAPLVLDAFSEGMLFFALKPEATTILRPGSYSIAAAVGESDAVPATVMIAPPAPGTLSAEQQRLRDLNLGQYYEVIGAADQAMAVVERLLARNPQDVTAWELKGDFALSNGDRKTARAAYDAALESYFSKPDATEEPRLLLMKRNALYRPAGEN